jgi:hypothetical protein
MADTDSPLAQVDHLLQQREQYEQWLARLDGTGSKAPDAVRQKVRTDYQGRLDAVLVELRSHASAVETALSGHTEALASLEARQADIQERLAEAEIRHAVGEYTDDEWSAVGAEAEAALDEIGRRIGAEQGEITRLSAVLHLVAKPPAPPPAPSPALRIPAPMPEPPAPEPEAPAAPAAPVSGAPRFVPKTPGAMPRASTPMPPPPRPAAPVDELAFLKSVTGEHPTTRKAPIKKVSDSGPMRAIDIAQDPPAVAIDGDSSDATPTARPGTASNAKTLKCGECGTLNRPTEWYCERCGAELAAL